MSGAHRSRTGINAAVIARATMKARNSCTVSPICSPRLTSACDSLVTEKALAQLTNERLQLRNANQTMCCDLDTDAVPDGDAARFAKGERGSRSAASGSDHQAESRSGLAGSSRPGCSASRDTGSLRGLYRRPDCVRG